LFWLSAGLSNWHVDNGDEAAFKLIEEGDAIKISRTRITSLEDHKLHLSNGETITADALIFATGWKHPHEFMFDPSLAPSLGNPLPKEAQPQPYRRHWETLDASAEKEVIANYPILAHPPEKLKLHLKPYRQYSRHFRYMVPPTLAARGDHSIVFLGNLHAQSSGIFAEVCALWAVAYLEDLFPVQETRDLLKDQEAMEKEAARNNAWTKLRYLDLISVPLVAFEMREVIDVLLRDLGVEPERMRMRTKGFGWWGWKAWWREYFTGYVAGDYRGIVEEFLEAVEKEREGEGKGT
jgi:hypothetical protein